MTKLTKEKDFEYKTNKAASLDKAVSELTTDLEGVHDELDAVNSAWKTLTAQCVAKPGLQKELAEIASTQAKAEYEVTKPELDKAVTGIQLALKTQGLLCQGCHSRCI